jgi:hypothetical protein
MPFRMGNPLRDLLNRQAKAVSEEAIQSGGHVSAEQVEALGRLVRLVEICDAVRPSLFRKWWPAVALLSTLLLVSILFFARVSETEIELDLTLSEIGFVFPKQQILAEAMPVSALGVSGLEEIQLPRTRSRAARTLRASEGVGSAVHLAVASDGERQGTATLAALTLPAGRRVWLRAMEVARQYRLSMNGSGLVLRVDVDGPIGVGFSGAPAEQLDSATPRSILLRPGSHAVDLDLTPSGRSTGAFPVGLSASDLSLFRIDQFMGAERTVIRRVSTILSGTLRFEALHGQERSLRPGEGVQFARSHGEIRALRLYDDHIALKFHGRVRGMTFGSGENHRSLMPTYFEWLRARHGLSLLWGTTLYVFGLIVTALRWWGTER